MLWSARSIAASLSRPVVPRPAPRRGWSSASSMMVRPTVGSCSATRRRTVLEPTSMAARRRAKRLPGGARYFSGLAPVFRMVLDGAAFHQENHVLPDVGGQIGHPLEVPADQEQFHAGADGVWIFHHMGEQNPEHRAVERVHLVVPETDLSPCGCISPNERLQG